MYACIHTPDAGALARSFSPWVEMVDERTAVFSITRRQLAEVSRIPRIAIAGTIEAAILAARNFPGVTIVEPGDESRLLGSLPLDTLPPDPEIFQTLDLWGIDSLASLAGLPETGIAERLGPRGLRLQRLARGALDRPLQPAALEIVYEEHIELDHPIEQLETLLLLAGRFLQDLCARLDAQSLAAGALQFTFDREERLLRLPFPTRDVKFLLKLVQHHIESHPLQEAPSRIRLVMVPVAPRRIQHSLFTPAAPEPEKLELTLGKIRALVGAGNVNTPELRNSYRPGWSISDVRLAFRCFRPPLAARVETEAGVPKHLAARVCRGNIVNAAGPWRSSGEWWLPGTWNRDEWDLALADGAIYRVFRDHLAGNWFLEGLYD